MNAPLPCRTVAYLAVVLMSLVVVSPAAGAIGPTPIVRTDKAHYFPGDTINVSFSGWNFGKDMDVDVYIGLLTWWGEFLVVDSSGVWVPLGKAKPYLTKVPVSSPSELYALPAGAIALAPGTPPGLYAFNIWFTKTGSPNWASDMNGVFFSLALPGGTHYYVDAANGKNTNTGTSETSPWKTITHALSHTSSTQWTPAIIHAKKGTYAPSTNGETYPLVLSGTKHLRGEGADKTKLDAEKSAFHVIRGGRFLSVVEGFTITGGNAKGPGVADQCGGGVYCPSFSEVVLQNNVIEKNDAVRGAAVYFEDSAPIIHHNTIQNNAASDEGGGIACSQGKGGTSWAMRSETTRPSGELVYTATRAIQGSATTPSQRMLRPSLAEP